MNCRWKSLGEGKWECAMCHRSYSDRVVRKTTPPPRNCSQPAEPCRFLGDKLGTQECQGCQGTVRIKLFACEVHGKTTLGKKLDGMACCANCPDYQPKRDSADDGRAG